MLLQWGGAAAAIVRMRTLWVGGTGIVSGGVARAWKALWEERNIPRELQTPYSVVGYRSLQVSQLQYCHLFQLTEIPTDRTRMQLVFPLVLLLPFLLSTADGQTPDGQVYGFVSFSTERVEVHEDSGNTVTTVQLPLIREVGSTGTILATVEVSTIVDDA